MPRLAIVTATTNVARAASCIASWHGLAHDPHLHKWTLIVENGGREDRPYLGTVPAFRLGIDELLHAGADVICAFHDDLRITETGWDTRVLRLFDQHPACGLAGFGGALGLGSDDLYHAPYQPMQLARQGFRSNLINAEDHGVRSLVTERVVCLDGFSQIGRREFWEGSTRHDVTDRDYTLRGATVPRPWTLLEDLGVVHHFYDGMLGCLAKRYGWETWYLPVSCIHYGGQTAVGDPGYQEWAKSKTAGGDHGFWEAAHRIGYEEFRDVLPLRVTT